MLAWAADRGRSITDCSVRKAGSGQLQLLIYILEDSLRRFLLFPFRPQKLQPLFLLLLLLLLDSNDFSLPWKPKSFPTKKQKTIEKFSQSNNITSATTGKEKS
jgi:hypothetical protein